MNFTRLAPTSDCFFQVKSYTPISEAKPLWTPCGFHCLLVVLLLRSGVRVASKTAELFKNPKHRILFNKGTDRSYWKLPQGLKGERKPESQRHIAIAWEFCALDVQRIMRTCVWGGIFELSWPAVLEFAWLAQ